MSSKVSARLNQYVQLQRQNPDRIIHIDASRVIWPDSRKKFVLVRNYFENIMPAKAEVPYVDVHFVVHMGYTSQTGFGIGTVTLSAASASRCGFPSHGGIKPNRQRGREATRLSASFQACRFLALNAGRWVLSCCSANTGLTN
nr:hypothetical protein [Rhodobaca barguzinensis]